MHVSYIVNASALTPTMYMWPWLLNREAERQKDLQKKFPEVSNSEPSKTKTQHVSEKACDMCFSLFCLLYYQFAECHVAFLQHGRMDHLLWRHARSRSWINLANKALEAARRTQASSSCLRCWNHVPFLGIQTTFCQEATYPRYMLILFDAVVEKGQLHAIYTIPTMVLLAKDTLKNSQEKENAPIQKQKVGPCDQVFWVFCILSATQSRNHVKQCSQFCIPGGGTSICSVEIILFRGSRARLRILWMHSNASNIEWYKLYK